MDTARGAPRRRGGASSTSPPAGAASAYLLDTYPGNSLRLITRDPWLGLDAKLPVDEWTHVAATVDGETGKSVLYINGEKAAER